MKSRFATGHRVSRGKKLLLAAPVLAGAAVPASQAAIIFTNVNGGSGLTSSPGQQMFFSVTGGTYRIGTYAPGDQVALYFLVGNPGKPLAVGVTPTSVYGGAAYATKLNAGASISGSAFIGGGYMANAGAGPWASGGNGYLGLKIGSNYGWANVSLVANTTLTLYGFAYDNTGAPILAGAGQPVPEPAETALLGALVAGSAAAFAARRKRKLAAQAA